MTTLNRMRSEDAFARAQKLFPGGVNSPVRAFRAVDADPFIVSHGHGPYLYDLDGNRYIDYVLSRGPLVLGHANPQVVETLSKQAAKGTSFGACSELESMLAEYIIAKLPSIEMLRFVNSGTEAGMSVIRLARAFTGRNKILKFAGCYHGHLDALLVKAGSGVATLGLPDCAGIPNEVTAHTITAEYNNLASVEEAFALYGDDIAAIIVEPVVGNSGLILPQTGFLEGLRQITKQHGTVLIFDEVMTGFRVHPQGAQILFGVTPDLTMLGKVIGGGLPVGAFGGRKEIMSLLAPVGPVYQAGTLSGNPLAMVAGLTTLQEWDAPGVFEVAQTTCKDLVQALLELSRASSVPLVAESAGTMFGFFFQEHRVHNLEQAKRSNLLHFKKFFHGCLAKGIYFAPSQFEAGFISNCHKGEPLDYTLAVLENVLKSL